MNKIYKINGKKIKIDPITINPILLQLLEALSDKEENKSCEECNLFYTSSNDKICKSCKDDVKQSTSLKEEVRKLVKECVYVGELSSEKISDKILSLIQFYLVKEVEQVEPTQYVKRDSELNQTYTQAKLDIIKIINNIC